MRHKALRRSEVEQIVKKYTDCTFLAGQPVIEPLPGGNNRLYAISVGEHQWICKHYFRHRLDKRDRLSAEYRFLLFAWDNGLRCVPRPIGCVAERSVGLYEFVHGSRIKPGDVSPTDIAHALAFLTALNKNRTCPVARTLPNASEACFSIEEHTRLVDSRLRRLERIHPASAIDREAIAFVRTDLRPLWHRVREQIDSAARRRRVNATTELDQADRIISPSDFGFHNALRRPDGTLCFLDFEYAGWDDPSKLVGDFFGQVAVPVPWTYFDRVVECVASLVGAGEETAWRATLLQPLYLVKWCCIVLNHFVPLDRRRKIFADEDARALKAEQLDKARRITRMISTASTA